MMTPAFVAAMLKVIDQIVWNPEFPGVWTLLDHRRQAGLRFFDRHQDADVGRVVIAGGTQQLIELVQRRRRLTGT